MSVSLHVEENGAGPVLVLLHGFTGSAADWLEHAREFSRCFRVLAVDLPGHGKSRLPDDPQLYRMDHCVEYLAAALDRHNVARASWLGYSMGGRVALAFAVAHPARIERLVLESAGPGIADPVERRARIASDEALAARIERCGMETFVEEWMARPLFASQERLSDATRAAVRAARLANDPVGLANSLRGMGSGVQDPLWHRLREIDMPVLMIVGEDDHKFRALAAAMRSRILHSRVVVIPRAGHNTHLENPSAFRRAVLEFLDPAAQVSA